MRKAFVLAILLALGSAVLGATVLREPLATAAVPFQNVIVANDAAKAVPVREQNLDADGNVAVADTAARTAVRYQTSWSSGLTADDIVPEVPAGKTFVISYINVQGGSGVSGTVVTGARCILSVRTTTGQTTTTRGFVGIPVSVSGMEQISASEAMTLPVEAGEALIPSCAITPQPQSGFFLMTVVGHYVSTP